MKATYHWQIIFFLTLAVAKQSASNNSVFSGKHDETLDLPLSDFKVPKYATYHLRKSHRRSENFSELSTATQGGFDENKTEKESLRTPKNKYMRVGIDKREFSGPSSADKLFDLSFQIMNLQRTLDSFTDDDGYMNVEKMKDEFELFYERAQKTIGEIPQLDESLKLETHILQGAESLSLRLDQYMDAYKLIFKSEAKLKTQVAKLEELETSLQSFKVTYKDDSSIEIYETQLAPTLRQFVDIVGAISQLDALSNTEINSAQKVVERFTELSKSILDEMANKIYDQLEEIMGVLKSFFVEDTIDIEAFKKETKKQKQRFREAVKIYSIFNQELSFGFKDISNQFSAADDMLKKAIARSAEEHFKTGTDHLRGFLEELETLNGQSNLEERKAKARQYFQKTHHEIVELMSVEGFTGIQKEELRKLVVQITDVYTNIVNN